MALFDAAGNRRLNYVPGTSVTGLYAKDGAYNVVLDSTGRGKMHPCGAYRVSSGGTGTKAHSSDGALYVTHFNRN